MADQIVNEPLIVVGRVYRVDGDLFVNGWVEVGLGGELQVSGELRCLMIAVENEGLLECSRLVTNVLHVDNSTGWLDVIKTRVIAQSIEARVVSTVQLGLSDLIQRKAVTADLVQHHAGDLNPSFDSRRGELVLKSEFFEAADEGEPVVLELVAIRAALEHGENPFVDRPVLVSKREVVKVAAEPLAAEVGAFEAWLSGHPGPQRATLNAVEREWLGRLLALPTVARAQAVRLIEKKFKSPKLEDDVTALVATLA